MKKIFLLCVLFLAIISTGIPAKTVDSFPVLDMDIGMKNSAMAGAFTGIADDSSAVYVNPAGLTQIRQIEINAAYDKWMLDSNFEFLSVGVPAGAGTICGSVIYSDMGVFKGRDEAGILTSNDINAYNLGGAIGFGVPVNDFMSAGLSLKLMDISLGNVSSFGMFFDAGVLMKYSVFSLGVDVSNIEISPNTFASSGIRAGLAAALLKLDDHEITADVDVKYDSNYLTSAAVGAEYTALKMISIRAGYKFEPDNSAKSGASGLTAGIGINLSGLAFEYAFESNGDLGFTNMAGIKFSYESNKDKEKKDYEKFQEFMAYQYFREGQSYSNAGDFKSALLKYELVSSLDPEYEGINLAISRAKLMSTGAYDPRKADALYNDGMGLYEKGDFDAALKKWAEAKKFNPDIRDIDLWIQDARDLSSSKPDMKKGGQYFGEGLKYYNNCDYTDAVETWSKGVDAGAGKKMQQYIDRALAKLKEMREGLETAKSDISRDTSLTEGIKKLRVMADACPTYKDAIDVLAALKSVIESKSKEYYYKGLDAYAAGNLDAAIVYWKGIEDMDPKSEYSVKVTGDIESARKKIEAVKKMGKQMDKDLK